MALKVGTRLGPYEIVAPLGAGGMGEVYKARDPRLNRFIAIKMLPGTAATDAERRERFEREAQAIAALNHPHIVTIHSVEEADGILFLTMELVEGRSLADALPRGGLPLDRLLTVAISAADAVAAAHQKGITHRDLKPGNIMLGEGEHEGRVKVLDFGLAKLAEVPAAAAGATALPTAPITGDGRILGTVAYMSPEQAEGKPIDARSDLFSFGVILYEMATGQRPFTGDTNISIISSIVKDVPKSVTDLNPALPRDLGRIVRRAMTKDLDRRYQSAKDLRNDLEELKAALDSGELWAQPASSGALPDGHAGLVAGSRRTMTITVAAAIVVLVLGGGLYFLTSQREQPVAPSASGPSLQDLQVIQLTTSGNAERPAISPDGKYVVYVQQPAGSATSSSVWIRQVATPSNVQIVPPDPRGIWGLTVTPDSTFVDYVVGGGIARRDLWRVPLLGGTPKKLLDGVDSPIGWSPDGRHMAFVRANLQGGSSSLVVAEADAGNQRELAVRSNPAAFDSLSLTSRPDFRPAWSMDGRVIAVPGSVRTAGAFQQQIVLVDAATGAEQAQPVPGGTGSGLDWLDAGSLVVNQSSEQGALTQLWRFAYPSGVVTRFTNDLSSYLGMSLTAVRDSLVTTRVEGRVVIAVGDGAGGNLKEVSAAPSNAMFNNVAWAADRLLFTSILGGQRTISSVPTSGGAPQEVVAHARYPTATFDGRTIVFESTDPDRPGLWKTTDAGRPVQLTEVKGTVLDATTDGRHVVFISSHTGVRRCGWSPSTAGRPRES